MSSGMVHVCEVAGLVVAVAGCIMSILSIVFSFVDVNDKVPNLTVTLNFIAGLAGFFGLCGTVFLYNISNSNK